MPMIVTITKKIIETEYNIINELQEKCETCELFKEKTADNIFIYKVHRDYMTEDGSAMVAIAKYGDTYAIHTPKYLTGKQWTVIEFLLRDVEPTDILVVFSPETLKKLEKYSYGKQLNVQMYV